MHFIYGSKYALFSFLMICVYHFHSKSICVHIHPFACFLMFWSPKTHCNAYWCIIERRMCLSITQIIHPLSEFHQWRRKEIAENYCKTSLLLRAVPWSGNKFNCFHLWLRSRSLDPETTLKSNPGIAAKVNIFKNRKLRRDQ